MVCEQETDKCTAVYFSELYLQRKCFHCKSAKYAFTKLARMAPNATVENFFFCTRDPPYQRVRRLIREVAPIGSAANIAGVPEPTVGPRSDDRGQAMTHRKTATDQSDAALIRLAPRREDSPR